MMEDILIICPCRFLIIPRKTSRDKSIGAIKFTFKVDWMDDRVDEMASESLLIPAQLISIDIDVC